MLLRPLLAYLLLFAPVLAENSAPVQPLVSQPIRHEVEFVAVVTPPYHCEVLKVWLPLPQSGLGQEVGEFEISTFPQDVKPQFATESLYGNRFAYFEFHQPQGAQLIRNRFQAKVSDVRWSVEPDRVTIPKVWPVEVTPYLKAEPIDDVAEFAEVLHTIAPQPVVDGRNFVTAMDWVETHLQYDHVNASLQADPNHGLRERCGHCSDYHGLCGALGRALGFPTRVTYGLSLYPKNSPSHCKLEAYLPPYGWVSFDISETQKLVKSIATTAELSSGERERLIAAAHQRLRAGFRENSWLLVTRGTDYVLAPPAARPVRVVRTIYAEADGRPLPEPDPARRDQVEFSWMTAHKYTSDRPFKFPFKDLSTLDGQP